MNPQQARSLKIAIGIATLVFAFWFVRSSGVVFESMRPAAEEGKLGNPAVAGALAMLVELLVALGGAMLVVFTGAWKWVADLFAPLVTTQQGLTADQFVDKALVENRLPPERKAQLERALVICVEKRDWRRLVKVAETLAGESFIPVTKSAKETEK